jgi:hypothetical protein
MTPEEKAKDILIKMKLQSNCINVEETKKLSIIAIDEILIVLEKELLELYSQARTCDVNKNMQNYYLKVKEEICKLQM